MLTKSNLGFESMAACIEAVPAHTKIPSCDQTCGMAKALHLSLPLSVWSALLHRVPRYRLTAVHLLALVTLVEVRSPHGLEQTPVDAGPVPSPPDSGACAPAWP